MNFLKVIIPSFNEIKSIRILVPKLNKHKIDYLIINDGSTDGTEKFLKNNISSNNYINIFKNSGYDNAIFEGYKYAKTKKYKFIATFDSDLQHRIIDLVKLSKFTKDYDLIIGNRDRKNLLIEKIINKYFYKKYLISDILSGLKIYNIEKINFHKPNKTKTAGMFFSLIAISKNIKIKNYPIKINNRKFGKSKFGEFITGNFSLFHCFINTLVYLKK